MSALIVVCATGTPAEPAEPERELAGAQPGPQLDRLRLPTSLTMEPIRSVELLPGGTFAVAFDGNHLPSPPVATQASRRLPSLWKMEIDPLKSTAHLAQYELISGDGRAGGLSLVGGDAFIPVVLESIEPTRSPALDGSARLEGGVNLHLSFDEVKRSGNYVGTLIVTLHRF